MGTKNIIVNTIALKKYLLTVFDLTAIAIPVKIKNVELSIAPAEKSRNSSGNPKAVKAMKTLAKYERMVRDTVFEKRYSPTFTGVTKIDWRVF